MYQFFFFFLLLTSPLLAQYSIQGTIIDSTSNDPLPFVNITFNNNSALGTTSNIDGYFDFSSNEPIYSIQLSYVGYQTLNLSTNHLQNPSIIALQKTDFSLDEVVVIAGENPAYSIIRKASRNRPKHDPDNIPAYTFDSYNKLRVYDQYNSPTPSDEIPSDEQVDFYYSLMEIISKIKYIAPDKREETIVATKVAGFKNPTFVTIMTEMQPTSFHKENLFILDKEYLNPLSNGCIKNYEYRLEDTIIQGQDSTFLIRFFPRKGTSFDALQGVLYINTNGYALQNVIAEPDQTQKIHLRIQQQYDWINEKHWFPTQLNFEIELAPRKKDTFTIQGKKYLTNINFTPAITAKDFGINKVTIEEDAHKKDSIFWLNNRIYALNKKELETYKVMAKVAKKLPLDLALDALNEWEDQRVRLGDVALNYTQIMGFNLHERFRLGLSLYTSYKLCPYFSFGGYFAYGFKDKRWKYGGSLDIRPEPNKDYGFQISYFDDITEPAAIIQNRHTLSKRVLPKQSFTRSNVLNQMDRTYEMEISGYFRLFRHLRTRIFGNWSHKTPLYDYSYQQEGLTYQQFKFARVGIQFRFSYKEDYVKMGSSNFNLRRRYPVIYLSYTRGIKGFLDGEFDYHKIVAGLESSYFIKNVGRMSWFVQGGWVTGETPYPILFNGRGSFDRWRMFLVRNTFQTMRPNEFVVDKFIYVFLEHNFGSLLFNTPKFKPEVKLYQSIGFGWLDQSDKHQGIPLQDMRKGYFESGLMLSNLIRVPIFNFGYFGVGAGVFVRYGAYYLPTNAFDNIAIKINMTVTF